MATKKQKLVLNNNGIGLLLSINALLLVINIIVALTNNDYSSENQVAHASGIDEVESNDKRKSDDSDSDDIDEEVFGITYKLESVAHFTESIEGIPMYFSHYDESGAYFTYMKTEKPKEWKDGYWYVPLEVLEQGYYDVTSLQHNDELRSIYINDNISGGYDYMQLRPASDLNKGYAFQ